jgi:hypothetical protein
MVLCVQNDMSEARRKFNACAGGQRLPGEVEEAVGVEDPLVAAQAQGSAGWQVWPLWMAPGFCCRICGNVS